jgi:catechol 2,3-dioxygenase-like lactoylglutathione lyase family enzyme
MSTATLEHVNLTVNDLERSLRFVQTALPDWRVRGRGHMDWFGKPIQWLHVGSDEAYLALQSGGESQALDWQSHQTGVKHVGLVVRDLDATVGRLTEAGFALDHWGGTSAYRRSAYFVEPSSVQFEFVEYLSEDRALRNHYAD